MMKHDPQGWTVSSELGSWMSVPLSAFHFAPFAFGLIYALLVTFWTKTLSCPRTPAGL